MSNDSVDPTKYAAASDPNVLELIVNEADKRVQAQVQLLIAADQRANGILAGCVTLAAGGLGFAMAQYPKMSPLFWSSLTFGVVEIGAAVFALSALWPEPIKPQGWAPIGFKNDLAKSKVTVQGELAKFLQDRIEQNRMCAAKLSTRIRAAMLLGVEGPIVGLSAGLIASGHDEIGWFSAGCAVLICMYFGIPLIFGEFKKSK